MNETGEKHAVIREIARGTGLLSSGEAVAKLFSLLGFVLLLRLMSVTDYGTYRLVFAAYGALYLFTISGINSFLQPDLAYELGRNERGTARQLFRNFAVLKIAIGCTLFILALFGANIIEIVYSTRIALYLRIISPLFLVSVITEIVKMSLAVDRRFASLNLHNVSGSVVKFLGIVLFVWFLKLGVLGAILAVGVSMILPLLLILPAFSRSGLMHIKETAPERYPLIRSIRQHGKWAIGESYFNGLGRNLAPLVIKAVVGTEAVAVYGVADAIVSQAGSLSALKTVLVPIVPREIDHPEHAAKILAKGAKYSILFNSAEAIALAALLPLLILRGFPQYAPFVSLFQWALVALIPAALGGLVTSYIFALRMQRGQFWLTIGQTVLEGSLLALLGYFFGLPGLIASYIAVAMAYQSVRLVVVFHHRPDLRFRMADLFSYDSFDRFLIEKFRFKFLSR